MLWRILFKIESRNVNRDNVLDYEGYNLFTLHGRRSKGVVKVAIKFRYL